MSSPSLAAGPGGDRLLDGKTIGRFLLPLMLNAWLMALAGPVLNIALGRASEPRMHLAAFWIAFGVLLACQSVCLVLQQVTASALARHEALRSVAWTGALLSVGAAALVLAIATTPIGDRVFGLLIPRSARTAELARAVLARMSVIPLLVGLRGIANGVAVFERRTKWLAIATLLRVGVLGALTAAVIGLHIGSGAIAATWTLVAASATEAIFVTAAALARRRPRAVRAAWRHHGLSLLPTLRLAVPLAAASLVWTSARPLVGAVLGRLADPELAQAGFGIVVPILFVTCAPLWALLDAAIVLPRTPADLHAVLRFALASSLAFTAGVAVLAWTPMRVLALRRGLSLPPELEREVLPALGVLALEPVVLAVRAIAQGLLVRAGRTGLVLALTPLKLAFMLGVGLIVARFDPHANGAVLALGLFIGGDALDAVLFGFAATRLGGAVFAQTAAAVPRFRFEDERSAA